MKSLFNRCLALLMTLSFLVSTTGIVLASHRCLANDHQTISLFTNTGCCEETYDSCKEPVFPSGKVTSACCVTEYSFHKVEVTTTAPSFSLHDLVIYTLPVLSHSALLPAENGFHFFAALSPPLLQTGKSLLLSIRCLLV